MTFYRGTIFGHLLGGEIWNATIHMLDVGGNAATISADLATAVTSMWSGTNSPAGNITLLYPATIGVDGVRVDELDSAGKNVGQAETTLTLVGTGSGEAMPPQVAIAVSLRTTLPTRAGRGRFNLPSPVVSSSVSQRLDSTLQLHVKNGALAMINSLRANSHTPIIYHRNSDSGTEVSAVDVGDVYDTQNPRRNQLVETRVRSNVT